MKLIPTLVAAALAATSFSALAATGPTATTPVPVTATTTTTTTTTTNGLQTEAQQASYSIGLEIGSKISQGFTSQGVSVDPAAFTMGIQDALSGSAPKLSAQQMQIAVAQFQVTMMQQAEQKAQKAIAANYTQLAQAKTSPVGGNVKGNTTLIEFFDYQCVHCRAMQPVVVQLLKEDPNLKIVYKEFPIFGPQSDYVSAAALASVKQGKYDAFHNALMVSKDPLNNATVLKIAKSVGINTTQLQKDMKSPDVVAEVSANRQLAQAMGIQGTPAFIIVPSNATPADAGKNSTMIPGGTSIQNLQQSIAQVQNAQAGGPKANFPKNEATPAEASTTWQGI